MNKILIVVDMQNDFINGSLGSEAAQAIVKNVVEKIKNFNGDAIIKTMDSHEDNYLETQEGRHLPIEHCILTSNGWHINGEVEDAICEFARTKGIVKTVIKTTFGAKTLPSFIEDIMYLKAIQEKHLEIELVGLDTDICVISNALLVKAFFPEAEVKIYSNCCAGTSKAAHEAALTVAKSCQINVI
jgi:nicotinamidase-related amidase